MSRIQSLKKRKDFLRLTQEGVKWVTPSFVVQGALRIRGESQSPRLGLTVSRKIGGAVVRNRVKRRLREIVWAQKHALENYPADYVIIARPGVVSQSFEALNGEFKWALKHVLRQLKESACGSASC